MAALSERTQAALSKLQEQAATMHGITIHTKRGDTNMGTLRTLNLTLIDNHPDLKAAEKVVFQQLNYVTEHTNEQTIQQVLMTGDVESALAKHNAKRAKVMDDAILRNTGRDVFLKPVEIWDLNWQVVQVA